MIERIYIPTIHRPKNQITYESLPPELQKRVVLVIDPNERDEYEYDCEYLHVPEHMLGTHTELSQTRELIHRHAGTVKYVMADDDIVIKRVNAKYFGEPSNMDMSKRDATNQEILELFETMDKFLDEPDIGVCGIDTVETPPNSKKTRDTTGLFCFLFIDGKKLSGVLDDMDLTSTRVGEDVMFMFECLTNGLNTRMYCEYVFVNNSVTRKDMQKTRKVWKGLFEDNELPPDYFQTKEHYKDLEYIANKHVGLLEIYEKDGRMKNRKNWKKAYRPQKDKTLEKFFD